MAARDRVTSSRATSSWTTDRWVTSGATADRGGGDAATRELASGGERTGDESPPVDFLGPDSWLSAPVRAVDEVSHGPGRSSGVLVVAALVLLVVAFGVLSPPSAPAVVEEPVRPTSRPPDRAGDDGVAADAEAVAAEAVRDEAAGRLAQRALPVFDGNVPDSLPGVLVGLDHEGSVVLIDRTTAGPTQQLLGPVVARAGQDHEVALGLPGAPLVGLGQAVDVDRSNLMSDASGVRRQIELTALLGQAGGRVVVVSPGPGGRAVTVASTDEVVTFQLPGTVEVLGAWDRSLLVRQAGSTWLLDPDGSSRPVTDRQVLTFDGRHVVTLGCSGLGVCRIEVGSPDQPARRSVVLPDLLARLPVEAWATSLAVSPDGSRLGASVDRGPLSLPMVIDLDTGTDRTLADGMNDRAPVAFSPDGAWLAYTYTDDVMVWPLDGERSWRINLDRDLDLLLWR